jgi:UDP-N-acetylmuramyl tripeptide synthase
LGFRETLAVIAARVLRALLLVAGRRATSLPGLVALRICPSLLAHILCKLDVLVIVTGTNGKTTTTALLEGILSARGEVWLTNRGGANLSQGLLAALLPVVTCTGRMTVRRALLEVDEATLPHVSAARTPELVVVTNVLRDQLDRYGEVDQALAFLCAGVRDESCRLVTNADDPLAASLGHGRANTFFFGMDEAPASDEAKDVARDGSFCLLCGRELVYTRHVSGQMGDYACPQGHFSRPLPHTGGRLMSASAPLYVLDRLDGEELSFEAPAPVTGLYNQYNVLAAVCAARALGCTPEWIVSGLAAYRAPMGRMQRYRGKPERILTLVKNPAGANAVLQAIESDATRKSIVFAINDADADGRDVSWLWDVDLESFVGRVSCERWFCAGTRKEDMALRLAYAGVPRAAIALVESLNDVVAVTGDAQEEEVYVLSTYTALQPLSDILAASLQQGEEGQPA